MSTKTTAKNKQISINEVLRQLQKHVQLQLKLQLKDSKALLIQDIYLTFVLQKQVQLPLNLQLT